MKHAPIERLRLSAKRYHRTKRGTPFEQGILIRHAYDGDDQRLTWWDYATFVLNDYRIALSWEHPRMVYQSMCHFH
ncbi:hypothetical protein [Undibacterium terreum]|uniref:Uncharacterized protein n=1 Tax=Undibacterium terreum TaxID=1224302 RepID=A0A916V1N0_9BURK|nr:hypothetical protein [Undibacterium terreum]GGC96654.1 hypothetical protein GCM10011396_50090 [Undibacterium terreum]